MGGEDLGGPVGPLAGATVEVVIVAAVIVELGQSHLIINEPKSINNV